MISRTKFAVLLGIAAAAGFAGAAHAQTKPITTCDAAGIGAAKITVDKPAKILEAAPATAGKDAAAVPYCLVKVLVPVGHCAGGAGPQPQGMFDALVNWVEKGEEPKTITASKTLPDGKTHTRPLCAYPAVTSYKGIGSTDDERNFQCAVTKIVR